MGINKEVWERFTGFYRMTVRSSCTSSLGGVGGGRWLLAGDYGPFDWAVFCAPSNSYCILGFIVNNTFLLKIWTETLITIIDPAIPSQKELLCNIKLPTDLTLFLEAFLDEYYP